MIIIFLVTKFTNLGAQTFIFTGKIVDDQSGEPLINATAKLLKSGKGTISDLDGTFYIKGIFDYDTLLIEYIGFKPLKAIFKSSEKLLSIRLQPKEVELSSVKILPTENPAHRLIRLVQKNANSNKPENIDHFKYSSYNKTIFFPREQNSNFQSTKPGKQKNGSIDSLTKKMHLMLWETVTERYFIKPDKSYEKVIASKISGLKDMALPFSPTDFQALSFYTDWVNILGYSFLSPIAENAIKKYRFQLIDTLLIERKFIDINQKGDSIFILPEGQMDTVFTISFEPRVQNFNSFSGQIQVNSFGYAIQSIKANALFQNEIPYFKNVTIKQIHSIYSDREKEYWFPSSMETDFIFLLSSKNGPLDLIAQIRTYIKNFNPKDEISKKIFGSVVLDVIPDAGKVADQDWSNYRVSPLNEKEKNTYYTMDSLGKKINLSKILSQAEKLQTGTLGIGFVNLELRQLYYYNPVEKHHFGLGLITNEKISKNLAIGGYIGYGTEDGIVKRGGVIQIYPLKDKRIRLHLKYDYNIHNLGGNYLLYQSDKFLFRRVNEFRSLRSYFYYAMNYFEKCSSDLYFPGFQSISHQLTIQTEYINPAYSYSFRGNERFKFSEIIFTTRIAPGEKYIRMNDTYTIAPQNIPVIEIKLTVGSSVNTESRFTGLKISDIYNPATAFTKIDLGFIHKFNLHNKGNLKVKIIAGAVMGSVPIQRLTIMPVNGKDNFTAEVHSFNTIPISSGNLIVAGESYLMTSLSWEIRNTKIPFKKYSPDPIIRFVYGISNFSNNRSLYPETGIGIISLNQGFYEAGIALNNILPEQIVKNVPTLQFLGVGVYKSIGAVSNSISPNWNIKMEYLINF